MGRCFGACLKGVNVSGEPRAACYECYQPPAANGEGEELEACSLALDLGNARWGGEQVGWGDAR